MPQPASALEQEEFLRLLIVGAPKVGKSTSVIATAASTWGHGYVINTDNKKSSLNGALRRTKKFDWDYVKGWNDMQTATTSAREGVKADRYKWVCVDTLSSFATRVEEECLSLTEGTGGKPDGRRAYPEYERRLRHTCERFFALSAHVIMISHYIETGGQLIDGQLEKVGEGIVPLLAGKARATVPMLFDDVIFFDYRKGERVFVTGPQGVWGPGCRSLEGTSVIPADIGALVAEIGKLKGAGKKVSR